jgi:hypothetical protein
VFECHHQYNLQIVYPMRNIDNPESQSTRWGLPYFSVYGQWVLVRLQCHINQNAPHNKTESYKICNKTFFRKKSNKILIHAFEVFDGLRI